MNVQDPHDLQRFIDAQEYSYLRALDELRAGKKRTHWVWYIFPQIAGLGTSLMSLRYSIQNIDEATAYLNHEVLGSRLIKCSEILLGLSEERIVDIMGSLDDVKLQSSMTLFNAVAIQCSVFQEVLNRYYEGCEDLKTIRLLR